MSTIKLLITQIGGIFATIEQSENEQSEVIMYDPKKNRLAALREKLGMTQREMSQDLGIAMTTFTNFEYGYRKMNLNFVVKVCKKYNCSSDWLTGISKNDDDWELR